MDKKYLIIGIVMVLIANLSIPQPIYAQYDSLIDSCIRMAIKDFAKSKRFDDKVYSVSVYLEDTDVIGVSFLGNDENKYYANPKDKIDSLSTGFPTEYIEIDNKLFCWQVPDKPITPEIIAMLLKYNHIDSTYAEGFNGIIPEYVVDDKKKGVDYYFCRNNIRKFKKVKTSIGIGYYKRPKLKCD